jgi:phosphoglycolate phosphatase-like HAD superfamily hydrolase
VDIKRQKPEPDGVLSCLERLTAFAPGCVLYIGDHETDVRCARNAQRALNERGIRIDVVSVAACFDGHSGPAGWANPPDFVAWSPPEIARIAARVRDQPVLRAD